MKKKFTAVVLSISMCLIPISQMQVVNAKTTTQEQKDDISLKFIRGKLGSSDKYEITPKDKLKEIAKIFVENNEYEKKDYKAAVFGKAFYLDLSNNFLYLGQDPKDNEVIKIEFKDKSSISFKKVGSNFVKVEEKNNETPSTPNENPNNNEQKDFSLKAINESFFENKYSIEPKDKIGKIKQIFLNNKEYRKTSSKAAVFGENYFIDEANKVLYLGQKVPDGHIVKFVFDDNSSVSFERKGKEFVKKESNYSKKYHLRIVGSFEAAIIGQQKYDAVSSATGGGVNSNKNSNVKLQIAYTDKETPSDSDFKDAKDVANDLQLEAKIISGDSGMQAKYSKMDNSVKLSGIPSKKGTYKVFVQSKDGKLKSNELDFEVFDSNEVTLEERLVESEFRALKNPETKKEWDMKPWVIKKFGKDKEEVTVPKNLKLWFGSRESGKYSELGYPIDENKPTTQTLVVTGELYLINMKILSSVNIVVKDGGKLNLSDSSLYGKITVENGGTLEVNYDDYHKSFASGSSINGQIILKDGATLQNSVIYSNANYLTDGKNAKHIQNPVVSVQGNATIKGNVFIRGDEAPTGEQYKGQGAMEIAKGKTLTIEKDAKLGLFAGGRYALTSNGGDALKLEGTVTGKGTLIAVGGNGRFSGKGGNGVSGNGTISVDNAYLRGGNSYMSKNEGGKAVLDSITIEKNTKGYTIDGKNSTNSVENAKLQNEAPNWNGYTAPSKELLDKLSTENAPSIVGEREKEKFEKELENIKNNLEKIEKEFENIKQEYKKSNIDVENAKQELEKVKQELEKSQQELEKIKQSDSEKQNEVDELSKKIKELKDKVNSFKAELEKVNNNSTDDNNNQNNNTPKLIKFLYGENQTVTKNDDNKLYFRLDEDVKNFENVLLDGKVVDSSMYNVKSGSTIIEFTQEFKNSLANGNHNLEFKFKNGYANTNILVLANNNEDKNNNKEDKNNNNVVDNKKLKNTNKNNLPKTNISNSTMLLAITSLAGFLYSKKKNK